MLYLTKQKKQSFLYGATILMVSITIVKIIGAIFKIPLMNTIKATGMAYFNTAYNLYTFVYAVTVTGLAAAVARMVAENVVKKRYRDVRKILKLANLIFLVLGTLGFVFIVLFAKTYTGIVESPNSYWSIIMIAPAIFFCCIMASYRGYYEGLSDMIPTAITQVVEAITKLITGILFAMIVMGVAEKQYEQTGIVFGVAAESKDAAIVAAYPFAAAAAILGVTLSTLVGFIYIFIRYKIKGDYITKDMVRNSPKTISTKALLYRLIKIAIPITLGAVVVQLSALIDTITIMRRLQHAYDLDPLLFESAYGYLLKDGEKMNEFLFGCFGIAITVFSLVPAFTNMFGKSALPNVTSAWIAKDRRLIKTNIESVIRMTMLVAAPAAFGITFLAKPIIVLLSPKVAGAAEVGGPLLVLLGLGSLCLSLVGPMNAIMQGIGRLDLPVKYLFTGVLIKLVMNLILVGIPSINIMGGAISTLCCYSTIAIFSIYKLNKIVNVKLDFMSMMVKPLVSGFACGLSAFLFYNLLSNIKESRIITILSIGIGAIVYVIMLGITNAISKEDILMLPKGNKIVKTLEKIRLIR